MLQLFRALGLVVCPAMPVLGKGDTINRTVTDPPRKTVPNAKIAVTHVRADLMRSILSGAEGRHRAPASAACACH